MSAVSVPEPAAAAVTERPGALGLVPPVMFPWHGERPSLGQHTVQCRQPGPGVELQDAVRYRYMRVLQQDGRGRDENPSVSLIPLLVDKPFSCSVCGHTSESQAAHRRHARAHGPDRRHVCPHCARVFLLLGNFRRHLSTHESQQGRGGGGGQVLVHRCTDCQETFSTTAALRRHRTTHVPERPRPHACATCGKSFRTAGYLAVHERVHSGERPFSCSCGKAFTRRCNLRAHLVSHTRDRPHACARPGCGLHFQFRKQLDQHQLQCSAADSRGAGPRVGPAPTDSATATSDAKEADIVVLHAPVEARSTVTKPSSGGVPPASPGDEHAHARSAGVNGGRDHPVPLALTGLPPGLCLLRVVALPGPSQAPQDKQGAQQEPRVPPLAPLAGVGSPAATILLARVVQPGPGHSDSSGRLPVARCGVSKSAPRLRALLPAPPGPGRVSSRAPRPARARGLRVVTRTSPLSEERLRRRPAVT